MTIRGDETLVKELVNGEFYRFEFDLQHPCWIVGTLQAADGPMLPLLTVHRATADTVGIVAAVLREAMQLDQLVFQQVERPAGREARRACPHCTGAATMTGGTYAVQVLTPDEVARLGGKGGA